MPIHKVKSLTSNIIHIRFDCNGIFLLFFYSFFWCFPINAISQQQINFQYTGKVQRWFVPSCVERIRIEVWGAQGGASINCTNSGMVVQEDGGLGGYAYGELDVTQGQLFYIVVGGKGKTGRNGYLDGGYNGGGDGGMYAAGGGGATDIRTILHDLDSRIIVGGGGGGGNTGCPDAGSGGHGGGLIGQTGTALYVFGPGGEGGSQIAGGLKGNVIGQPQAEDGSWWQGGNAGSGEDQFHISGGGGGWYGGGSAYAAGGGGGSSNIWYVQNSGTSEGQRTGNGLVRISLVAGESCVACAVNCLSTINVSMPIHECYAVIQPEDVLAKINNSCTTFGYTLNINYPFGTSKLFGNDVDRSHLGHNLVYSVTDASGQNTCWGSLKIEDKAAPVAGCQGTRTVSCFQLSKLLDIKSQVIDNCSAISTASITKMTFTELGCTDTRGIGRIVRTIRAGDSWGNSSNCTDTLYISRDTIDNTMAPDQITLNCKVTCKTENTAKLPGAPDYEDISFSKDPKDPFYPSPELLFALQRRDSFNTTDPCLASYLNVVPFLYDSVLVWDEGEYIKKWEKVNKYKAQNAYCKSAVNYTDQVLPVCDDGTGFKIRREWLLVDWCTGQERIIIQYIEVLDQEGPRLATANGGVNLQDNRLYYRAFTDLHSCYAKVSLKSLITEDCSPALTQTFVSTYTDPKDVSKIIQQQGPLSSTITLPAIAGIFGVRCHLIDVTLTDGCKNSSTHKIEVCVIDDERPKVIAHETTRATVDPATCWSRIYAKDLDNGSKDNCCNVLHFAIASMDSILSARKYVYDAIIAQCGVKDYQSSKEYYDFYIEDYISSYIFKDYLDLTACTQYQIVLRVWEACGIPRFDPHIWPCSEHQWFLYNAGYPRSHYRADHNLNFGFSANADYNKFKAPKDCNWRYPLVFCDPSLKDWFALSGLDDFNTYYEGAGASELCNFSFYWPRLQIMNASFNTYNEAPGNTCSRMLWQDVMVLVTVDDKTPPLADEPEDLFWYCDHVGTSENNSYENVMSACNDYNTESRPVNPYTDKFTVGELTFAADDNIADFTCRDKNNLPYNRIECIVENDESSADTTDPTGKSYGWYGCGIYGPVHVDDHMTPAICPVVESNGTEVSESNRWIPIYCHTWLCLDKTDGAGKINPATAFAQPVLRNGSRGAEPSTNEFIVLDNCAVLTSSFVDEQYSDKCGTGWLKRTWTFKDECGLLTTVDQKILTKHRSDFEITFPADLTLSCESDSSVSPNNTGRPMIMDDDCELVGIHYTDQRFDIVSDACYKIIRTWKIVDWCAENIQNNPDGHYLYPDVIVDDRLVADTGSRYCVYRNLKDGGDGYMLYSQIIKVIDTKAPALSPCKNDTVCILDGYTGAGTEVEPMCTAPTYVSADFDAADNCSAKSQLRYRWELDVSSDGKDLIKSAPDQKRFSSNSLIQGKHFLYVIATDHCGNEDTTSCILTVLDCKAPTPYCYNGLATVVMPSTGTITVWAKDLDAGSYDNCTLKQQLRFSFSKDSTQALKEFTCKDLPDGRSSTIPVSIYVWDAAGLTNFCSTYLLLQDGVDRCPDTTSLRGGTLKRMDPIRIAKAPTPIQNNPGSSSLLNDDPNALLQNIPNPFDHSTRILFNLATAMTYELKLTDLTGRTLKIYRAQGNKGINQVMIHRSDLVYGGVYYYTLSVHGYIATKKMIVLN